MKIFLCDDQKEHIGQIVDMFSTISGEYPVRIESFTSAEKLLEQLEKESVSLEELEQLKLGIKKLKDNLNKPTNE